MFQSVTQEKHSFKSLRNPSLLRPHAAFALYGLTHFLLAQFCVHWIVLERETGIEPATNGLGSRDSTTELLPLSNPKYKPW
jgi:hypothetical protein